MRPIRNKLAEIRNRFPVCAACISYQQLLNVAQKAKKKFGKSYPVVTMRDVCREMIAPTCRQTGKCYALSLNLEGLSIDVFVTHSWDGPFASFVESLQTVFQTAVYRPNLWICAFALLQGDFETTLQQIHGIPAKATPSNSETSLEDAPFVRALKEARYFCVVRNTNTDLYSRIWCVCEAMYAEKFGLFPKSTFVSGPAVFRDQRTSCRKAKASRREDKERILQVLETDFDWKKVDQIIHAFRTHGTYHDYNTNPSRWSLKPTSKILVFAFVFLAPFLLGWSLIARKATMPHPSKDLDPQWLDILSNPSTTTIFSTKMYGTIPTEIGQMPEITSVYLSKSKIFGEIPSEIGRLKKLQVLHLENNRLGGSIPSEFGLLTELKSLILGRNMFSGTLPSELGLLKVLEEFDLPYNDLFGGVPSELGLLTALTVLHLQSNSFTGSLPAAIENLTSLMSLSLADNLFSGSLPKDLQLSAMTKSGMPWDQAMCMANNDALELAMGPNTVGILSYKNNRAGANETCSCTDQ